MNEEHAETCECAEHHDPEIITLPMEHVSAETLLNDLSGTKKLSPEEEKKEAQRKLRNARKKAKEKLLKGAISKRERKFVKKILGTRMAV